MFWLVSLSDTQVPSEATHMHGAAQHCQAELRWLQRVAGEQAYEETACLVGFLARSTTIIQHHTCVWPLLVFAPQTWKRTKHSVAHCLAAHVRPLRAG